MLVQKGTIHLPSDNQLCVKCLFCIFPKTPATSNYSSRKENDENC